jgi:putative component of membrane protein insertase Oxa1/YidC/SpoIIIJ protein YidD
MRGACAAAAALAAAACTSGVDAGDAAIGFYQRHLGSQWAFHCDFQPSCSNYGKQSVDLYGLVPGTLMTADRLMRDHNLCHWRYAADDRGHPLEELRLRGHLIHSERLSAVGQLVSGVRIDAIARSLELALHLRSGATDV